MIILMQNTTGTDRYICRFGGEEVRIPANDFVTFDCTDFNESTFWITKSKEVIEGIKIIVDPKTINLYKKLKNNNKFESLITSNKDATIDTTDKVDTGVKDTTVEPVVSEPVQEPTVEAEVEPVEAEVEPVKVEEDTVVEIIEPETVENVKTEVEVTETTETVETNSTKVEYTEEYLKSLTKNELYPILDELNIKYKRNNSVSKLVSLILETNSED